MRQDEVIQELLRNAPASPTDAVDDFATGEKVIRAHDLGPVDADAITAWVEAHGGRAVTADAGAGAGDLHWVVAEAELAL